MFGKALEMAILQLQAVVTDSPANGSTTDGTTTAVGTTTTGGNTTTGGTPLTPEVQAEISFNIKLAAFIFLGLGIAFTFFGALFMQLFISLFTGLVVGAFPYFLFGQSTGALVASVIVFGVTSFGCWHLHRFHAALVGAGVGAYVGSIFWDLLDVFGIFLNFKFIFAVFAAAIFGHYAYYNDKNLKKIVVHATAFLGSNMIATSITFFTDDKLKGWGNLGVKIACIVIFSIAGHYVQHKLGLEEKHKKKMEAREHKYDEKY